MTNKQSAISKKPIPENNNYVFKEPFYGWILAASTQPAIEADGIKSVHNDELILCSKGFHASNTINNALRYCNTSDHERRERDLLCRVKCEGEYITDLGDNQFHRFVCKERTIIYRLTCEQLMNIFQEDLQQYFTSYVRWNNLPSVVSDYFITKNETLKKYALETLEAFDDKHKNFHDKDYYDRRMLYYPPGFKEMMVDVVKQAFSPKQEIPDLIQALQYHSLEFFKEYLKTKSTTNIHYLISAMDKIYEHHQIIQNLLSTDSSLWNKKYSSNFDDIIIKKCGDGISSQ